MIFINDAEFEILLSTLNADRENPVVKNKCCKYINADKAWSVYSTEKEHFFITDGISFKYNAISYNMKYIRLYQLDDPESCIYVSRSKKCPF